VDNYYLRLIERLRHWHYDVGKEEAADAVSNLWSLIEGQMHDTAESIQVEGEQKGVLAFSDLRMTWRAINRRGDVAYFLTRDDAAQWLRNQPPLGYRAANGNASGS
jgi:hypothetical protein